MQLLNYSFEHIVFALCTLPRRDFRLLSSGKFFGEKSTHALDKVPPAGPGCQAGRILLDSMISHGNECKSGIHALNYMTLRASAPSNQASAISLTALSLSGRQAVKFLQCHYSSVFLSKLFHLHRRWSGGIINKDGGLWPGCVMDSFFVPKSSSRTSPRLNFSPRPDVSMPWTPRHESMFAPSLLNCRCIC